MAGEPTVEVQDVGLTSDELFRSAMLPDPETPPPGEMAPGEPPGPGEPGTTTPQQSQQAPQQPLPEQLAPDSEGRLRNSRGQFASPQQVADHTRRQQQGGQQPGAGQQQPQGRQQFELPEDPNAMVPSWRLREEREQREAAAGQYAQMQQQYERMMAMVERMQQQPQSAQQHQQPPAPAPDLPDPVLDPQGYRRGLEGQFNQALRAVMLENNLRMTSLEVGKPVFEAAYNAFLEAGRVAPDFARSVVNSPDPGERIMSWYNNQRVLQEIGGDPHAWMARQLEQALANPAFLARAVDAATSQARGGPAPNQSGGQQPGQNHRQTPQFTTQQPARSAVVLPPSLTNMRGATSMGGGGTDGQGTVDYGHGVTASDDDLFREAMSPAHRRR